MVVVPVIALALIVAGLVVLAFAIARMRRARPPARVGTPVRRPVAGPRRKVRHDVPHALYRYPPRPGGLTYYGISNEPAARDRRHARDSKDRWWYEQTTGVMHILAVYPDRATARAAEDAAILAASMRGDRLGNTAGNPFAQRRRSRARIS